MTLWQQLQHELDSAEVRYDLVRIMRQWFIVILSIAAMLAAGLMVLIGQSYIGLMFAYIAGMVFMVLFLQ